MALQEISVVSWVEIVLATLHLRTRDDIVGWGQKTYFKIMESSLCSLIGTLESVHLTCEFYTRAPVRS